ncbi:SRPBCC family protein [Jatrophihabitans lederbergiae]|jgi:ribosome-associated toxin RatA of RatAB toxin-antitoxin module|uniref:SRPBCC family protein n=1 Tax=Jatrophihabitans lederbergiae TaxID=3075547 RepID=A0ABU2J8Q1_9ACTN|nr:SRPBCC family protein [Jatrophihabitans sp. DSM 44399]MDT0261363.1 SRPBCC family protein [Jatrophihabitans sp. DSM 44399]
MADESTQSITISAPPAAVMAVIADFEAYPQWAASVKSAQVTEAGADGRADRVAFKIDAGVIRDEYELSYVWNGDEQVSWMLVKGQMQRAQRGSYLLRPTVDGTDVTYNLSVDLAIPMLGMLKRKAEKVVMDTALKELKKRVENSTASAGS